MTAWRAALEDARRPPTVAQQVWDGTWRRNYETARRLGRTPNQAATIADTRTEAQKGQRPTNPKEIK